MKEIKLNGIIKIKITEKNLSEIKALHDEWTEYREKNKLRISFAGYIRKRLSASGNKHEAPEKAYRKMEEAYRRIYLLKTDIVKAGAVFNVFNKKVNSGLFNPIRDRAEVQKLARTADACQHALSEMNKLLLSQTE